MRSVSAAIQTILDADQSRPVVVAKITLVDSGATELFVATHAVTISAQPYTGDIMEMPRIVVSAADGLDHIVVKLNNADWSFSSYHNANDFDGALVEVSQYFATNPGYTTFEGPVQLFTGTIFRPEVDAEVMTINVMADARMARGGSIGRIITNHCGWEFGSADSNCGYTSSAQVQTGAAYTHTSWIPLTGSAETGQAGVTLEPSDYPSNYVSIWRGGYSAETGGTEIYSNLRVTEADLANSQIKLNSTLSWSGTLQAGDYIVYQGCPRDIIRECGRRWKFAEATRQQDKFGGMDYFREQFGYAEPRQGVVAQMDGVVGNIIPIPYGTRWTTPLVVGVHSRAGGGTKAWAAWNSTRDGPFAVCVIGEGLLDTAIDTVEEDVLLDGATLRSTQYYVNQGWDDKFDILVGTKTQAPSDFFPQWDRDKEIPGHGGLRNVGYFIMELPENYDLEPQVTNVVWENQYPVGWNPFFGPVPGKYLARTRYWAVRAPDIQCKYKGKKVQKYAYSGSTPITGAYEYSRNPVWQILDVLTAPEREDESDRWSAGLATSSVDLGSFIDWADYAEDTISVYDFDKSLISVERYRSDLYVKSGKRADVLAMLLQACRGSLVAKDGKVGIVLDAPTGGKGTITGATSTIITESTRNGLTDSTWPDGGVSGLLTGLRVKILTGTGAGQVRTIASNTASTLTVSSAFSPTPSVGGTFAIYALELNIDNVGPIKVRHKTALHELTNQVVASYQSTKDQGRDATVPIPDTYEDDQGNYHYDKFGLNEKSVKMEATTEWQQAVRNGWYELRKGLDQNFEFYVPGLNIEGMVLEIGDIVLINHDISGIANEVARVVRIEDGGGLAYSLTCEVIRDHVYLNFPTDDFDSVDISSTLKPPHGIPPHVTTVAIDHDIDFDGEQPLVTVDWDQPEWQYANWYVIIEMRYRNPQTLAWTSWSELGISKTRKHSFRASRVGMVEVRPVLTSAVGVRGDAPIDNGTSSGGNTSTTLNDTAKAWATDEWYGCSVEIIAGTGYDADDPQIRVIASNTATELTVTEAWDVTPDGTSEYDIYVAAPVVQEQITAGIGFGNPHLDEDDGDLYLSPGWLLGTGCKYLDSDTEPTENDVQTTGNILTEDGVAVGGENIHTFTADGEIRYVGIVFYLDDACTQGESGITVLRYTYHEADNNPRVVWFPYIPDDVTKEGVRFVATDDSAQVNFGYIVIDEGDAEPTWPGDYTTSGLVADPYDISVEVVKPAEGGTRKVILFNAVDATGFMFRPADDPGRVYVDGNARPAGFFNYSTEEDGTPVIIPQAIDSDCMSWRFRVKKVDVGSESWDSIAFDDGLGSEYSGNTFNYQDLESYVLASGECLCVEGQFYRTSATDDTTQEASMASEAMQFVIYLGSDTIVPTVKAIPTQVGAVGNVVLELNDPQNLINGTAFQPIQGGNELDPGDPDDPWDERDVTADPGYNLTSSTGVALVEGRKSTLFYAFRYSTDGGVTSTWVVDSFEFDKDFIPSIKCSATVVGPVVYLRHDGDEDTKSVEYLIAREPPDDMPSEVELDGGGTIVNSRSGLTTLVVDLLPTEALHIRVRAWSEVAAGGNQCDDDWRHTVKANDTVPPTMGVQAFRASNYGKITLLPNDPSGLITGTAFLPFNGSGDFDPGDDPEAGGDDWAGNGGEVDESDPYTYTSTTGVALGGKHSAILFYAYRVDLQDGNGDAWIIGSHNFGLDAIPDAKFSLTLVGTQPRLSWSGDPDMSSGSVEFIIDATDMPADFTDGTPETPVNGQSGVTNCGGVLTDGQTLFVRARAWTGAGGTGTSSPAASDFTGEIQYNAGGETGALAPLAVAVGYDWKPSLYTGAAFTILLHLAVGSDVASIEFEVEGGDEDPPVPDSGGYNYTSDIAADTDHELRDEYVAVRYFTSAQADEAIPVRVRGWSGAGGTGTSGSWVKADVFPAEESGAGVNIYNQAGTLIGGPNLTLAGMFEVTRSGTDEKVLGVPASFANATSDYNPDYADGPVQTTTFTVDRTIAAPLNVPDGATFVLRCLGYTAGVDLTLASGWNCAYGNGPFTPYNLGADHIMLLCCMNIGGTLITGIMFG